MKRMLNRSIYAVLVAGLLAACSSDTNRETALPKLAFDAFKDIAATRRAGPRETITLPASELAKVEVALLQVNPEVRGGSDFLQRVATRNDSALGRVEIWESSDRAQVFLRNGVVVGTRGIGGDIIAAGAKSTVHAVRNRVQSSGIRSFVVSDGDNTTTDYQFRCEVANLGSENIIVANQRLATDHLQERCVGGSSGRDELRNDFWVQRSTGQVRKSRQWMGPRVGYFEIKLLKN
ncbi:YjbF family lipoprotein [Sulfitobacter sp. HNIBRBA2951]|uniref:YjbF family lipoprotein n=1 Tax=Sulfitobacter aquimarinus TaxID=3158557 RepID=UPI0032DF2F94